MVHQYWPQISGKWFLRIYRSSVHQSCHLHSNHCIDVMIFCSIFIWVSIPIQYNILVIVNNIPHKLWVIEYHILIFLSLDHHYLTSNLPLKGGFRFDSFSRIYIHLIFDSHKTTVEHIIWICLAPSVVDTNYIPWYVMIRRHHISVHNMILLEVFLLNNIINGSIYFIG